MGNKPTRQVGKQSYNQMVEDAISALKERPGSTQSDILQYLEDKYEKKISPQKKKKLGSIIRSEKIKSKIRGRGAGDRLPKRGYRSRRVGFKVKDGPIRKFGCCDLPRGGRRRFPKEEEQEEDEEEVLRSRPLGLKLKETIPIPKPHMGNRKPGKKSLFMSGGRQRQQLRGRPKAGTTMRGSKLFLRPARRAPSPQTSEESNLSLPTHRGRRK